MKAVAYWGAMHFFGSFLLAKFLRRYCYVRPMDAWEESGVMVAAAESKNIAN